MIEITDNIPDNDDELFYNELMDYELSKPGIIDEQGVRYSEDGKNLIEATIFLGHYDVKSGTKSIDYNAFYSCPLFTIHIPDSVETIGSSAFSNCVALHEISLPESVTSIGNHAFWGCTSLSNFNIPNSVTHIGNQTIANCTRLKEIYIPGSVTSLGLGRFNSCTRLEDINVSHENKHFASVDGILFSKDLQELIRFPEGKQKRVFKIPEHVIRIGDEAFLGCNNLHSIIIHNSVTSIGHMAFGNCKNLQSISMADNINDKDHYYYSSLDTIVFHSKSSRSFKSFKTHYEFKKKHLQNTRVISINGSHIIVEEKTNAPIATIDVELQGPTIEDTLKNIQAPNLCVGIPFKHSRNSKDILSLPCIVTNHAYKESTNILCDLPPF